MILGQEKAKWDEVRIVASGCQILKLKPQQLYDMIDVIRTAKERGQWRAKLKEAGFADLAEREPLPPGFLRCGYPWEVDHPGTWGPKVHSDVEWPDGFKPVERKPERGKR